MQRCEAIFILGLKLDILMTQYVGQCDFALGEASPMKGCAPAAVPHIDVEAADLREIVN